MSILLDTNLLLRSVEPNHALHGEAQAAVTALLSKQVPLCLVAQRLYEFWVVATRPTQQNGLGLSATQAESELAKFSINSPSLTTFLLFARHGRISS